VSTAVHPDAAEVLRRLELDVTRRLDGLLHGDYRGLVPGHGSETGETRPYVPGDDVRRIDWNVSARSVQTHVRESIADRELETWVLVDRSPSLDFGTARTTKAGLALEAVGAIGFLTARTGNRLGAVIVDPGRATVVPARPGREHLLAVLHSLLTGARPGTGLGSPGEGTTDLGAALRHLVVPPRRRGLVVIVSDFLSTDGWGRALRGLTSRHDIVAIEVVDPRELELPPVGVLHVVDPETGREREVATTRRTRARYAAAAAEQRRAIADELRRSGVSHLQLRTDRDWVLDIARFVRARRAMAGVR
jgi:uncharacterized protein (DUF58 family)